MKTSAIKTTSKGLKIKSSLKAAGIASTNHNRALLGS
jgi:hypothetical protein